VVGTTLGTTWFSFIVLAIGLALVSVIVLLLWMKRHGWSR